MGKDMVQLTEHFHVMDKTRILYCYETEEQYVKNAVAYIVTGVAYQHHLLIVEPPELYSLIESKLSTVLPTDRYEPYLHYVDNHTFYCRDGTFQRQNSVSQFRDLLIPLFEQNVTIRMWAHVEWDHRENFAQKLTELECHADAAVKDFDVLSVCTYNANLVPASLLPTLLRSHGYYMTDFEFVKSPLYRLEGSPLPNA